MKIRNDNREKKGKVSGRKRQAKNKQKNSQQNEKNNVSPNVSGTENHSMPDEEKTVDAASTSTPNYAFNSTPRRNRDILSTLQSSVSEKCIGITPGAVSGSKKRKRRSRRNALNNSADFLSESDAVLSPLSSQMIECLNRSQPLNTANMTPNKKIIRKPFVSPIDKLLLKNKSSTSIIKATSVPSKRQKQQLKKTSELKTETIPPISFNPTDADELVTSSHLGTSIEIMRIRDDSTNFSNEQNDGEAPHAIPLVVITQDVESSDKVNVKIENKNMDGPENDITLENDRKLPSDREKSVSSESIGSIDFNVNNDSKLLENDRKLLSDREKCGSRESIASIDFVDVNNVSKLLENVRKLSSDGEKSSSSESIGSTDIVNVNNVSKLLENDRKLRSDREKSGSSDSIGLIDIVDVNNFLELINSQNNNCVELDKAAAATIAANVKSPSIVSSDSATGSSVSHATSWMPFTTGDVFWGKIYSYCYWPCMVCPDPDGKTVTTGRNRRHDYEYIMVHVRFFADGRRNWVRREKLMAFQGLDNYRVYVQEMKNTLGQRSFKYKIYLPRQRTKLSWFEAIREATVISNQPYADRLEKFYELAEKSSGGKIERKRRESMNLRNEATSDFGSQSDSSENLIANTLVAVKRERSSSPSSPAYSPIQPKVAKKARLMADGELDSPTSSHQRSSVGSPSTEEKVFSNKIFKKFHGIIKDFVMEHNLNAELEQSVEKAARNIWALKHINQQQSQKHFLDSFDKDALGSSVVETGHAERAVKRLSNRLKNIKVRTLVTPSTPELSLPVQPPVSQRGEMRTEEKPKRLQNRPIAEVIDDIFRLDSKYLFKHVRRWPLCKYCQLSGGKLIRCSKSCRAWLHSNCIGKIANNTKMRRSAKGSKFTAGGEMAVAAAKERMSLPMPQVVAFNDAGTANKSCEEAALQPMHIKTEPEPEIESVVCRECAAPPKSKCSVCDEKPATLEQLLFCNLPRCAKAFHASCCRYWPQAKIIKSKNVNFRCPSHVCHTCVSDDPSGKYQLTASTKLVKCVKCPASYHMESNCIPAGSEILSLDHIICPRHSTVKTEAGVNVSWCFICAGGDGTLLCCDTCPMVVHAACLNIPLDPNEAYICEDCEAGRMPLYGEIVWAKFNAFRWWPAIILPPPEVPQNIVRKTHNPFEFVVRFFGTHDHGWISRRRVYLYNEADLTEHPKSKSNLNQSFIRGVEEAKKIYEMVSHRKQTQRLEIESKEKLYPQPYVRIRANRAVPPVKLHIDMDAVNTCNCDPNSDEPCGPYSNCLNRALHHECNPKLCPAGDRCQNQMFMSKVSPRFEVVYTKERGFGLVCREPITEGSFIIEYVGEVINDAEYKQRLEQKKTDREGNYYFLSLEKGYFIDAGPKGNAARFMNHSCEPNCQSLKWSVNGVTRVGLFAIKDIPKDTELTFNYNWEELVGVGTNVCHCGAAKCGGQIGRKYKEDKITIEEETFVDKVKSKPKKKTEKKKNVLKRLQKKQDKGSKTQIKIIIRSPPPTNTKMRTKKSKLNSSPSIGNNNATAGGLQVEKSEIVKP